jgi:RNA 2',3'-cyclic 3'-phosphodiesterase
VPAADAARCFFALWPAAAVRDALAQWTQGARKECGGRATAAEKIHLTLAFLGNVERSRIDELRAAAAVIAGERFTLALDQAGYWRHNRIVWAGATEVPPALTMLVSALGERVKGLGYRLEERPYAAHITLLRNARRGASPALPLLRWAADEFTLVESKLGERGSRYVIVDRWPLGAGSGA